MQQLDLVVEKYSTKAEVTSAELADMLSSIIEGGVVITCVLSNKDILVQQLLLSRWYLKLLYREA